MMKGATNNNSAAAAAAAAAAAVEDLDLEMEALLQGMGPPFDKPAHQLVRQGDDVLVAIASVEELNAALAAEAPPPLHVKGVLRGYVLPTLPIKDCLLLKAAAEAGSYGGRRFCLADHAVVDAKISCRASVDQARAQLGDAVSALSSLLTGGFAPRGDEVASNGGGTAPYADEVESTRREVVQGVESTIAQIKALSERLDSV